MSICAKCGTPVYFAERRTSLGLDWHPGCLTCFECGKRLHPGQHAGHQKRPYCEVPCYSLLFGPTNFRHGVGVATGQESPETRRRMLGKPRVDPPVGSSTRQGDFTANLSPPASEYLYNGNAQPRPFSPSSSRNGNQKGNEIKNRLKSPAFSRRDNYPLALLSPPSSPSRNKCRKRLYDSELDCNLPKDITKDQLFRTIHSFNEYFTSPTSSGYLGDTNQGSVGQNWKFLIDYKERNGKFILESMLKIRWGVKRYIQFLEKDEVDPVVWRRSYLDRLADSETSMLQLLQRDSYKKRQSFQSVINHSTLGIKTSKEGNSCKSPKKEVSRKTETKPTNGDSVKPSRSFYDNVPNALAMLQNGAQILADDDDDGGKSRISKGKSPHSSSASSPSSSRSPSPRRRSGSLSVRKESEKNSDPVTSKRSNSSCKRRSSSASSSKSRSPTRIESPSFKSPASFNNPVSSTNVSTVLHNASNYSDDVFKTAKAQFSSPSPRILPNAIFGADDKAAISEDEGFQTGASEIFYTAKSQFFYVEKNPFPFYDGVSIRSSEQRSQLKPQIQPQSAYSSELCTQSQYVVQLCSPDKRLTPKHDRRTNLAGSHSASSTSSLSSPINAVMRNFAGGPAKDLAVESEKWKREAERWRKKLEDQTKQVSPEKVVLRHPRRSKLKRRRLPSINGHVYNPKTRVFVPDFDTISTVRVDNMLNAEDVIQILLSKFRIENDPKEFMLYVVRSNGETFPIEDDEYPLYVRLKLGPCHDESQFYIMERNSVETIGAEVAMLMSLPMPILERMEEEISQQQEEEEKLIRTKVAEYKKVLLGLMRDRKLRRC